MSIAKQRGAEAQRLVAGFFARNGWPYATDAGAGRNGSDILGVHGLEIEVKARRDFDPGAWIRQAQKQVALHGGLPAVVLRPYGMGSKSVGDFPVILRLADFVALLHKADYGEPLEVV